MSEVVTQLDTGGFVQVPVPDLTGVNLFHPQSHPRNLIVGWDTETFPICAENICPQIVCFQYADDNLRTVAAANAGEVFRRYIQGFLYALESQGGLAVAHSLKFDLGAIVMHMPDILPQIFRMLVNGNFSDTLIREKLLNLTTHGSLEYLNLPDGNRRRILYGLDALVMKYYNVDISANKKKAKAGEPTDAWRVNFNALHPYPIETWPAEPIDYALSDSIWARDIWFCQEQRREELIATRGVDPFEVETFRCSVDFAFQLMTAQGFLTDEAAKKEINDMLARELATENMDLLIATGILRPAEPPRPFANGAIDPLTNQVKMTGGCDESKNVAVLREYVLAFAQKNPDVRLSFTAPSDRFPEGQLQVNAEFLAEYADRDPVLEQLQHREKLQKLVTTEMPRMQGSVIHPCYDVLKETGRSSSFASELHPSLGVQNVDPRVRGCVVPREGRLLFSEDYHQMELGTLAEKCMELFGFSVLADKINAGIDPHAYLGAQLAYNLDPAFNRACQEAGAWDGQTIYLAFKLMAKSSDPENVEKYQHYRKFAKPTGLGYPGGLGAKTFIKFAKATYGVVVDEEMAKMMRTIWLATYPEMPLYFDYIKKQSVDPFNFGRDKETGEPYAKYKYTSPMGMLRAGCDYCAAANGMGLQTPSAEGALLGLFDVVRACYDESIGSPLYGNLFPIAFIHDEIVGEVVHNEHTTYYMQLVGEMMVNAMQVITPHVKASYSAALMRRWDKKAESELVNGQLTIYEPPAKVA